MSKYSRRFVISALFFLLFGGILGVLMGLIPHWAAYIRFSHIHMMLIGWMSMMIFGLGYHVIPRFSASQLVSDRWQMTHWWCANIALTGMISIALLKHVEAFNHIGWNRLFFLFGMLQLFGIGIFVYTMGVAIRVIPSKKIILNPCCAADKCK